MALSDHFDYRLDVIVVRHCCNDGAGANGEESGSALVLAKRTAGQESAHQITVGGH